MSNQMYEDKLYNQDRKIEFMSSKSKGTQKIYQRIFKVSYSLENQLDKDLADFNRVELSKLFYLFRPATKASSSGNVGYVSGYIDWCSENDYMSGLNPLDLVDVEWKQQFANTSAKRFWTDRELDKIIDSRSNAQDAAPVVLLRNGLRGAGHSELLNLDKKSIDEKSNQLRLVDDDGNKRTIKVSDQCIKICKQALAESEYEKMNGMPDPSTKSLTAQLVDNSFVLRNSITRTVHTDVADKNLIHRRISKIADEIGYSDTFTPINISRSGMLEMAKNAILDHGSLTDEDVLSIAIQFGENSDGAVYRLKSDFLNEDTVKSLYQLP